MANVVSVSAQKMEVERAFGAANRATLLDAYFKNQEEVSASNAWIHVYRLLLWIDRTIGLAHCYESDKCQPGRPWYQRSVDFHSWLSEVLEVEPAELGPHIDILFRNALEGLAGAGAPPQRAESLEQLSLVANQKLPLPGDDPDIAQIVRQELGTCLAAEPSPTVWRKMTHRILVHISQDNKRKNLLGEGFEDTLAAIIRRVPQCADLTTVTRSHLGDIPGFSPQGDSEKKKRVDIALWSKDQRRRVLVTSKWSVRADREEQFGTDFDAYVRVNTGPPFGHVLVTNEFDAARLRAACERLAGNAPLFSQVVHVNPRGVMVAYAGSRRGSAGFLQSLIDRGRLVSLEEWLTSLEK